MLLNLYCQYTFKCPTILSEYLLKYTDSQYRKYECYFLQNDSWNFQKYVSSFYQIFSSSIAVYVLKC